MSDAHDLTTCPSFQRREVLHTRTHSVEHTWAMLSSVAGALIGAVVGWALASLQKTARPARPQESSFWRLGRCPICMNLIYVFSEEYPEFQGLAALQKSLWTETSKAGREKGCHLTLPVPWKEATPCAPAVSGDGLARWCQEPRAIACSQGLGEGRTAPDSTHTASKFPLPLC